MSAPSKSKAQDTKEGSIKGDAEHVKRPEEKTSKWLPAREIVTYVERKKLDGTARGPRFVNERLEKGTSNWLPDVVRKTVIYGKSNELDGTARGPREVDDRDTTKMTGEKTKEG